MKHIDITFDLETCATTANAAVMQVAAVAWDRMGQTTPFIYDSNNHRQLIFNRHVDLRSCVMDCFDFDQETIAWWSRQSKEAKEAVSTGEVYSLRDTFQSFISWIEEMKNLLGAESICLWCQGMDFDGAILRNIAAKYNIKLPFRYQQFRDCRTVILEYAVADMRGMALCAGSDTGTAYDGTPLSPYDILRDDKKAYKCYDPLPDEYGDKNRVHDALYDCLRSAWNTWQALNKQ